jgi:hypothetical protein
LDFIGQPTWLDPFNVQATFVMRWDLFVSDFITLPKGQNVQANFSPQNLGQFKNNTTFQGTFQIDGIRHAGNFRQADATGWVTTVNAHLATQPPAPDTSGSDADFDGLP